MMMPEAWSTGASEASVKAAKALYRGLGGSSEPGEEVREAWERSETSGWCARPGGCV